MKDSKKNLSGIDRNELDVLKLFDDVLCCLFNSLGQQTQDIEVVFDNMNFGIIKNRLPAKFFGILPLQSGVELILIYTAINKMSGIFGLLSLFTSHPINFVQWVYYTLNCFILFVTTWCYISVRKLASQSLASNNSSAFLNQESNLTLLGVIALFVVVYILDFFTGNLFMIYLTNLWFEEEYSSTKNTSASTTTVKSSKDASKYLAKRVSETLSLQSASETYEVVVSLFTVILTEIVRIYFVSVILSYYIRLRRRITRQPSGTFSPIIKTLDCLN